MEVNYLLLPQLNLGVDVDEYVPLRLAVGAPTVTRLCRVVPTALSLREVVIQMGVVREKLEVLTH